MPEWVKVDGVQRRIIKKWFKVNGVWREIKNGWFKVSGAWRKVYDSYGWILPTTGGWVINPQNFTLSTDGRVNITGAISSTEFVEFSAHLPNRVDVTTIDYLQFFIDVTHIDRNLYDIRYGISTGMTGFHGFSTYGSHRPSIIVNNQSLLVYVNNNSGNYYISFAVRQDTIVNPAGRIEFKIRRVEARYNGQSQNTVIWGA